MKRKQFKRKCVIVTLIISGFFSCKVFASVQTFVEGKELSSSFIKDGRTYVQLKELAPYLGYEVEYDDEKNVVNFYKSGDIGYSINKRVNALYPSTVDEIDLGEKREIVMIYELRSIDNPEKIPKEPFERDGFKYKLSNIIKNGAETVDRQEHIETVTVNTTSQDINVILGELQETIDYISADGYEGVLKLDMGSIQSGITGYNNTSYNISETREYSNLSSPDTSLVPKTITKDGKTLNLTKLDWKETNTSTINYREVADSYTAVAVYGGTGTKRNVTGYTTTANYVGDISKVIRSNDVYTVKFIGEKSEITAKELKEMLKEQKAKEKAQGLKTDISFNPLFLLISLGVIGITGFSYWIFFRGNVKVLSMFDGKFEKIGKTKVKGKNLIIDLTPFTAQVTTPSFILVFGMFTAKRLNNKTLTINYGDSSLQHIVTLSEDGEKKMKGYQIELDF